jgi:hypothetical protein
MSPFLGLVRKLWLLTTVFIFGASPILAQDIKAGRAGCSQRVSPSSASFFGVVTVDVSDWHILKEDANVMKALNIGRDSVLAECAKYWTRVSVSHIAVDVYAGNLPYWSFPTRKPGLKGSNYIVSGSWHLAQREWDIIDNSVSYVIERQAAQAAAAKAKREKEEEAAQKQKAETQAREQFRRAALAECGSEPNFIGGPGSSDTYKVGALDKARAISGTFLCIKTIEYIGPAVNPFGGKAARAKFMGFDHQFNTVVEVFDFFY